MSRWAKHLAGVLLILAASAGAALAVDLEVVVHRGTMVGTGVAGLDLLLCRQGPCTAVATTDGNGHAVFSGVDAGEVSLQALSGDCGPFEWTVTVRAAAEPPRVEVVVPETGRLVVQVSRSTGSGEAAPLASTRVEFLIHALSDLSGFPEFSSAGTETDGKGFASVCLPAGIELEVRVRASGFEATALPVQQPKPAETARARITLQAS
jgi:hypothetical protein